MKVVQINATCGVGSTGKICVSVSEALNDINIENYIIYSAIGTEFPAGISCSSKKYIKLQALKSKILGNYGFNSRFATQRIIKQLENINPDIVHLHNIHGHDCNLTLLFDYFKKKKQKLYWTFHDCWAFTGYCPHFTLVKCDKWKTKCKECPQFKNYSWFFDKSSTVFQKKKALFSGLDLTIITPSKWLSELVKESFLKDYPTKVINNGIDLSVFKPTDSNFRKKYNCENKYILLGVAFDWGEKKGLDVFIELSKRLNEQYQIVLVGTNDNIDKQLPDNIISIHRTQNQQELAEIYTAADLFVNPTREENYPTVNMEAIACGTPVLTFNTGGSPEIITENTGSVVECDNIDEFEAEIERMCVLDFRQSCLNRREDFDKQKRFDEYRRLYTSNTVE